MGKPVTRGGYARCPFTTQPPMRRHRLATACLLALPLLAWAQEAEPKQTIEVLGVRAREMAGQSTLTRDELARVPGSGGDPMKAVQVLPGVTSLNDASSEPAVRGARPTDNLYYVDFLPVGYLFHVGGFASVFNGDLVRRFDLLSAAWGPEYGDALGAVFDLSLRRPRSDRLGGKLDFSLLGGTVLFEGPLSSDLSFFLSARRSWFDVVTDRIEDEEEGISFTVPVYSDVQGRLLWTLDERSRLRLDYSRASDRIDFSVKPDSRIAEQEPVLAGDSRVRQGYDSIAGVWDADLGDAGAHTLALGRMATRQASVVGSAGRIEARLLTEYLRHQAQWSLAAHELTLGGSLQRQRVTVDVDFQDPRCTEFDPECDLTSAPRVQTVQDDSEPLADLYLSDRWRFAEAWTATAGLRYSRDGRLDQALLEPRLSLEWNAPAGLRFTAAAGRHNQAPAIDQSLAEIGNPRLHRLRSTHAAFGVGQQRDGWSWRTEVYGKRFTDLVVSDASTQYRNGGSGTARGLELLLKWDPVGRWSGFASLSLAKAERRDDATGQRFDFEFDRPVIANFVGQYRLSPRWQFGAKWSAQSGAPYTPILGGQADSTGRVRPVYGPINSERLPPYHRLDLRADATFGGGLTMYFELLNAYARKNVAGFRYSADYSTREEVYQTPLLPSVGVTWAF